MYLNCCKVVTVSLFIYFFKYPPGKKNPILYAIESGLPAHFSIPRQSPVAKVDFELSGSGLLAPGFPTHLPSRGPSQWLVELSCPVQLREQRP